LSVTSEDEAGGRISCHCRARESNTSLAPRSGEQALNIDRRIASLGIRPGKMQLLAPGRYAHCATAEAAA